MTVSDGINEARKTNRQVYPMEFDHNAPVNEFIKICEESEF